MKPMFNTFTATVAGTTPINSPAYIADQWFRVSATATFTDATSAGAITLQGSNEPPLGGSTQVPYTPSAGSWVTIPNTSQTVTAGATVLVPSTETSYRWVRVHYVPTAGAQTVTVNVVALGY